MDVMVMQARQQMRARRMETESELALTAAAGSYGGLEASLAAAASLDAPAWVDAVRGLVRPVLTPLLWLAVLAVFFQIGGDQARWISQAERAELIAYLVNSLVFAATAATLWWFGDRPPRAARPGKSANGF